MVTEHSNLGCNCHGVTVCNDLLMVDIACTSSAEFFQCPENLFPKCHVKYFTGKLPVNYYRLPPGPL